ncbi:hypothetical protein B0H15DRAFT_847497, partial [Mycena belliarum]
ARIGNAAWQRVSWPGGGASAGACARGFGRDEDRAAHSLHAWVAQPRRRAAGTSRAPDGAGGRTERGSGGGSALLVADVRAGPRGGSWRLQWGDVGVPRRIGLYAGRVRARDWRGCRVHRARDESRCSRRRTKAGARAAAVDGRCADARRRCIRGSAGVTWQRPPAFARPRLSRLGASAAVLRDRAPLQWFGGARRRLRARRRRTLAVSAARTGGTGCARRGDGRRGDRAGWGGGCAAAVGDLRTRCASAGGGRCRVRVTWAYVRRAVRGVDSGAAARWGAVGRDSRASGRAGVRPSGAFSEVSLRHGGAIQAAGGGRLGARRTPGAAGARAVWTERKRRAPSSRRRVECGLGHGRSSGRGTVASGEY